MKPFSFAEYRDPDSGETPKDALANALQSLPADSPHLIRMAAFTRYLATEGQLHGRCLDRVQPSDIQIWAYKQGRFHLIYSYYRLRHEVCLLKFVNGDPEKELDNAKERLRRFYSAL